MNEKNQLSSIDHLEIEPLSDDLLNMVAGGNSGGPAGCSCTACSQEEIEEDDPC